MGFCHSNFYAKKTLWTWQEGFILDEYDIHILLLLILFHQFNSIFIIQYIRYCMQYNIAQYSDSMQYSTQFSDSRLHYAVQYSTQFCD